MEIIVGLIFLGFILAVVLYIGYKRLFYHWKKKQAEKKSKDLRYIMVKLPLKESDMDQKNDNIQGMKQNIEIMNQILKNFNSIYSGDFMDKKFIQNYISLEVLVEKEVIKYILGIPQDYIDIFEKIISSFYPGAVVDRVEPPKMLEAGKFAHGGYFNLKKDDSLPVKTYENFEADPMDSLLSSFSRVDWEEKLSLQILISPLGEDKQKDLKSRVESAKKNKKSKGFMDLLLDVLDIFSNIASSGDKEEDKKSEEEDSGLSSTQTQAMDSKIEDESYEFIIRALAISPHPERSKKVINDLKRSFTQYNFMGLNSFEFKEAKDINKFVKDFVTRMFLKPLKPLKDINIIPNSQSLNIKELSSIYHFPHSRFNKNPRIKWQKFKIVPAPDNLPGEGILLGHNLYSGVKKEVRLTPNDRFRHFYTIGQTGTGKSSMLLLQAKQDVQMGNGFTLVDPHGDLCEDLLKHYPKDRVDDLIYVDAGDYDYPVGINIFEAEDEKQRDIIVNDAVDMFTKIFGPEIFGPRLVDYFRNAALALMEQPEGGTLPEIVRMFTDEAFQKTKLKNVKNPVVRAWWEKTYASMGDREKSEAIPFFQAKFGPFTTTDIIKNIIGQQQSSFNIYEAMQNNKVILLNLSKGKMGEVNSNLLGTMVVSKIKSGALARAELPAEQRTDHFLYIDEFQNYITPSIETVLSEARKYRLGLIVAHQYLDQLEQKDLGGETDLKGSIFGNVGSMMAYKVGAPDAEKLEPEFSPEFSREDLINMDKFKGVLKLSVDTQPTKPFSLSVANPYENPINSQEKVNVLKEISRLKYGRKRELVNQEINYRIGA